MVMKYRTQLQTNLVLAPQYNEEIIVVLGQNNMLFRLFLRIINIFNIKGMIHMQNAPRSTVIRIVNPIICFNFDKTVHTCLIKYRLLRNRYTPMINHRPNKFIPHVPSLHETTNRFTNSLATWSCDTCNMSDSHCSQGSFYLFFAF